ncbi:hypothetical protein D1007_47546 [Hordeum vulgare]|nr:hypothetical protein D1007_47546 [Hordeum vulgare]
MGQENLAFMGASWGGTHAGSARGSRRRRRRRRRTERTPPPPPPLAGKGAGKRWVIVSPSVCSGRRRTRETRRGSPVSAVPVCWPKAGHRLEVGTVIAYGDRRVASGRFGGLSNRNQRTGRPEKHQVCLVWLASECSVVIRRGRVSSCMDW